jgi:hypothetical protein
MGKGGAPNAPAELGSATRGPTPTGRSARRNYRARMTVSGPRSTIASIFCMIPPGRGYRRPNIKRDVIRANPIFHITC